MQDVLADAAARRVMMTMQRWMNRSIKQSVKVRLLTAVSMIVP